MLYRAVKKLSIGIQAGEVFAGERLNQSALTALEGRGVIVRERGAPLGEFPEFAPALDELREMGIDNLTQLAMSVHPLRKRAWELLSPPKIVRPCRCGGR